MSKFNKAQFIIGKGYKSYTMYCPDMIHGVNKSTGEAYSHPNYATQKFVARFRTAGVGSFVTFLIKNFTVEEYFARMEAGETPLQIAESKGYMLPHIKKWLKEGGYEVSRAGYEAFANDQRQRTSVTRVANY